MTDTNNCYLTYEEAFVLIGCMTVLRHKKLIDKDTKYDILTQKLIHVAANTSEEMS